MNAAVNPLHLLVVDDDEVDRERVQRYLARSPVEMVMHEAASGEEALRMVRAQPFDCVVLDNQLGDATGSELLRRLRQEACQECPVIMVTGAGNEALVVQAMQEGASDYLSKVHLTEDGLLRSVMRSMETHQLRMQVEDMHRQLAQRVEEQAETIRQRERDLQDILDHASNLIGYFDATQRIRFGNRAFEAWFDIQAVQLPGMQVKDALGDDMFAIHDRHIRLALQGRSQVFEHTRRRQADGQLLHLQAEYRPDVGERGQVHGCYMTITDITQIKAAQTRVEELLRFVEAVIDNSPVGMAVYTRDGRCVLANAEMSTVTGMNMDRVRHLPLGTWMAEGSAEPLLQQQGQATLADGLTRHLEAAMTTAPNQVVQIAWSLAKVERGNEPHLLVIARNVTEQKLLHETLVNARNAAQEAARITSAFLANMSHEIRTPMNAIVGLSRLALEEKLPPAAHDHVARVHDSALALMGILDDVLDYSKVEAGQMRLEHAQVDVEDLLQRVANLFSGRTAQKHIHFDIDLDPQAPDLIMGDPLRLSQILNNLVGNAIKFTDRGGVRLVAHLESDALRFSVHDTGIGIDPQRQDSLFAAFSQGDVSITRRFGGTGLGLAICKKLVAMMGGQIGVNSAQGKGSEFWFTVPLLEHVDAPTTSSPTLEGRVLLVGPDEIGLRALGARVLAVGQHIDHARDLNEACARLGTPNPALPPIDTIVLDWPGSAESLRNAVQTLREQLARSTPSVGGLVPIIALTPGFERPNAHATPTTQSPDLHLVKPVLPKALFQAIEEARNLKHVEDPAASPASLLAQRGAPIQGCRVLLVEDNVLNQMVAQAFLQQAGLDVETLGDGDAAVRRMESVPAGYFSAILMDMHMPILDGLEASRRIRSMPHAKGLPIIAMTAAVLPADRERCTSAGMVDMVAKPVLPELLIDTLLKWIPH